MNNSQNFKQGRCTLNSPNAKLPVQLRLPLEPEGCPEILGTDGHTIISNMWEPEPVDFIPPSDGADRKI